MFWLSDEWAFAWAWAVFLLPLPWFIYRFWPQTTSSKALKVPFFAQIQQWSIEDGQRLNKASKWPFRLLVLTWLCFGLALMRPQWVAPLSPESDLGRELILAIDLSASMADDDLGEQNRLQTVQSFLMQWLPTRQGERIGVVVFGDRAERLFKPTRDMAFVLDQVKALEIGLAGGGTALAEGLAMAVSDGNNVILISDGANTHGVLSPVVVAEYARKKGAVVHTVGLSALTQEEQLAQQGRWNESQGPAFDGALDTALLKALSKATDGLYFRASDAQSLLDLGESINQINQIEMQQYRQRKVTEWFAPLWILAFSLLILALNWERTRWK